MTSYSETTSLPKVTTQFVGQFLINQDILLHGAPEVAITASGMVLTADMLQRLLRYSHTDHCKTTAYHPQTFGITEGLNKTIADVLFMKVCVEPTTLDEVFHYATFAYNTAMQEPTQTTPFELVYGRQAIMILDAMLPHVEDDDLCADVQGHQKRLEESRKQ